MVSLYLDNDSKIAKYDSSCNNIWELNDDDIGFDGYSTLKLCFDGYDYLIYYSNFLAKVDSEGNFLGSLNNNVSDNFGYFIFDDKYYCSGYDYYIDNPKRWIRRYSREFILEMQYSIPKESQYIISLASSIKILKDESILVFHDYEYLGDWDYGIIHTNMNIRHIDKNGNCISTLNLYEYGSQHTTELLLTKEEDYILYGYGYEDFTQESLVVLAKIQPWDITGVDMPNNSGNKVNIYPNPFNDEINIEFQKQFSGTIKMLSLDGRVLLTGKVNKQYNLCLNTSTIDEGIYLIQFGDNETNYIQKLIKL